MEPQLSDEILAAKKKAKQYVDGVSVWGHGTDGEVIRIYLTPEARKTFPVTEIDGFPIEFIEEERPILGKSSPALP